MIKLFNQIGSITLLSFMTRELHRCSKTKENWVFYAMTCYFNQDSIEKIASLLSDILGTHLNGFHLIVDGGEWLRRAADKNKISVQISKITGLELSRISINPIFSVNKLFHSKAYALIGSSINVNPYNNCFNNSSFFSAQSSLYNNLVPSSKNTNDLAIQNPIFSRCEDSYNRNGFLIITSANLTQSGLEKNIEIGFLSRSTLPIRQFYKAFIELQTSNSLPSKSFIDRQKRAALAEKLLSLGAFYHKWQKSLDFRFRLTLSESEILRLKNQSKELNAERYGEYKPEERRSLSIDPINIRHFFNEYPKPIPDQLWGSYSIETLLGQWVPNQISEIVEKELEDSVNQYLHLISELGIVQKLDEYKRKLLFDAEKLKNSGIIAIDFDSQTAVESWQKKIKNICENRSLIRLLICKYEKINITSTQLDEEILSTLLERIKEFYSSFFQYKGVAKLISELEESNFTDLRSEYFDELCSKVNQLFENYRMGDLFDINPDEKFIALCQPEFKIIKGKIKKKYKKSAGSNKTYSKSYEELIVVYDDGSDVERELSARLIKTFRKLS